MRIEDPQLLIRASERHAAPDLREWLAEVISLMSFENTCIYMCTLYILHVHVCHLRLCRNGRKNHGCGNPENRGQETRFVLVPSRTVGAARHIYICTYIIIRRKLSAVKPAITDSGAQHPQSACSALLTSIVHPRSQIEML